MAGAFEPLWGDFHYSAARISASGETVIPLYLESAPSFLQLVPEHTTRITIFNGTGSPRLLTNLGGVNGTYQASTTNLFLEPGNESGYLSARNGSLLLDISVPIGGLVELKQV